MRLIGRGDGAPGGAPRQDLLDGGMPGYQPQHLGAAILGATRGNMSVLGVSAVALLAATPVIGGFIDPNKADANVNFQCTDTTKPNFNTIVCGRPKVEVGRNCGRMAIGAPYALNKSGFVGDSTSNYRMHFEGGDGHGCDPVGLSTSAYSVVFRKGPEGQFKTEGPIRKKSSNRAFVINKVVKEAFDCSQPGMAGSAIETRVKQSWKPRPGWGSMKVKSAVYFSKPQAVCEPSSSAITPVATATPAQP